MRTTNTIKQTAWRLAGVTCLLAGMALPSQVFSQGCVIARGGGGGAMVMQGDEYPEAGDWQLSLAYRYFHSDRHFIGDVEQPQRQEQGTQVENFSNFIDLTVGYNFTKRFSLNLTLPFVSHERSSLYEHDRTNRYSSFSGGLGDARLGAQFWILNPETHHNWNFSLGAGVKAPTGDYTATDVFHRPTGPELRYVDTSIQPGDGGWGGYLTMEGFAAIYGNLSGYWQAFYLFNPEEEIEQTGYSIPDAYMARAGFNYVIWPSQGISLSLGGRIEGVPSEDAIGGSEGSRRPGYSVGIEPGISWSSGPYFASLTTPVAVYRNRLTTFGRSSPGDAAFADYSINFAFALRF